MMKLITKQEIGFSLMNLKPTKIASAYIGSDWPNFIHNPEDIEEIIISPTFGSNPKAIIEMAKTIGWDKLHLLDNLHAKFYLTNSSAIIGSANLTNNGLSGNVLYEACIETSDKKTIESLNTYFKDLKALAIEYYPDKESKLNRISILQEQWKKGIKHNIVATQNDISNTFEQYEMTSKHDFFITWYDEIDSGYTEAAESFESVIEEELHFLPDDNIKKDSWVLIWKKNQDNTPRKNTPLSWFYIDDIIPNGVKIDGDPDYKYTTLAFKRKGINSEEPPFEITDDFSEAFKRIVNAKGISEYLIQENTLFSVKKAQIGTRKIIDRIKKEIGQTTG